MKFCSGVYVQNNTVNNVRVGDWTDELAIIAGNAKQLRWTVEESSYFRKCEYIWIFSTKILFLLSSLFDK